MANRVHTGIYGMGIYAVMLPSSGFSVAYWNVLCEQILSGVSDFKGAANSILNYYPYRAFDGQNKIVYSRFVTRRAIFF